MFSKTCEYAIRAVIYIASTGTMDSKTGMTEISSNIEAPAHFTAKILQTLVHNDIVSSQKGVNGGFYMNKVQRQKHLIDIVRAVDGDALFSGCGLGLATCSEEEPCPFHEKYKVVRNNLRNMMESTSIDDMSKQLKKGRKFVRLEEMSKNEQ